MAHKTRKNVKKHQTNYLAIQNKYTKKGTNIKCKLKSCMSKKYQSVYGLATGGSIRKPRQLHF